MFGNRLIKSNNAGAACTTDTVQILDGTPLESIATYQLDGAATSIPNNTYPGTFTNPAYAAGKFGQAAVFNGSSTSKLTTNLSVNTASSFSISAWIKSDLDNTWQTWGFAGNSNNDALFLQKRGDDNRLRFLIFDGGVVIDMNSSQAFPTGQWWHFAATINGSVGNLYINGVNVANNVSYTHSKTYSNFTFGQRPITPSEFFDGSLDQVRIFNTALSAGAVTNLYNETVATASNSYINVPSCIAYYKMSDATDETGSYDGTPTNVNFNVAGKFGNAGEFNGSSSKIITARSLPLSNGARTISAWVKTTATTSYNTILMYGGTGVNNQMFAFRMLNGQLGVAGWNADYDVSAPSIYDGNWHNVVATYDGSTLKLYADGQRVGSDYSVTYNTVENPVAIGAYNDGDVPFNGKIDQVRIFNRAITANEVETLYDEVQCIPTIVPSEHFNTVIWTSTGGNTNISITGVGFQPDLVWAKARTDAYSHTLYDSVRGAGSNHFLSSNLTDSETTLASNAAQYGYLGSFDIDGFTGNAGTSDNSYFNYNTSKDYVAWNWKAGGPDVLNQEGTIDSQVSANTEAGFSVVKYSSGASATGTVGHGLTQPPQIVLQKGLGVDSWFFANNLVNGGTNYEYLILNTADAQSTNWTFWDGADAPNSTTFKNGWDGNREMINYCFAEVDGFSKFGSYLGGTANKSITLGFKPAFVIIKDTTTANNSWCIFDNKRSSSNPIDDILFPNSSSAESVNNANVFLNFNATGFTIGNTFQITNGSGVTYIFMAFAEEVFVPDNFFNDDSTVATYKLDGDAGDDSGNGYNGVAPNVTYAAGKFDEAAVFNGSSSKIDVSNFSYANSTFSISLWVNFNSIATAGSGVTTVLSGTFNGTNTNVGNIWVDSQKMRIHSNQKYADVTYSFNTNQWYQIGIVFETNGDFFGIVNGSRITPTNVNSYSGTNNGIRIGDFSLNGSIDQVRIFSTALTADNVTSLYNEVQCVPAIVPSDYFNPLLYTGNSGTQSIDDLTFQPDLVWIKERTSTSGHHLGDSVRGATKMIYSNLTNAESTDTATITSFDTNGFTVGSSGGVNAGTDNYVAWNWKSGGAPTTTNSAGAGNVPTAGSVKIDGADSTTALAGTIAATSISANTEAGFSIVSYTGNNSTFATIAHGLGQAPSVVIVKARNLNAGWPTQHNGMYGLRLNDTGANNVGNGSGFFSNTPPNSSVFTVGGSDEVNDGYNYIAYCFASIPGFSDIGSYIGTGASGNSIVTGFRPAYLMVKRTDSGDNWLVFDNKRNTTNPTNLSLIPNSSAAESVGNLGNGFSFLSNGFEVVSTDSGVNANGGSYIFMAFAEEVYNANAVTANQTNPFNDGSQVAQYEFEDNAYDSQPNGYIGKGGTFNGSSSVITIPNIKSQLQSGASFTISCWVNVSSSQSGEAMIINTAASSGTQGVNIGIRASTGLVYFQIRGNNNLNASGTTNLVGAGWKNIVLTHTTSSTILYVNGTQEASIGANTIGTIPNDLTFGKWASSSLYYLNGSIDQVRIYNTALNPNDVWLLYSETSATSSTLDYPASTGAQALYELEGNANDTGGTYNGTATDVAWVPLYDGTPTSMTYAAPSVSTPFLKAGDFNGSSSYIDTSIPLNSNLGSVSLWVKTSDTIATFFGVNANSDSNRFYFGVRNSNFWTGAGNLQKYTVSASNLIDNNWHNVVITLNGSVAKYYLDGAEVDSTSYTGQGSLDLSPVIGGIRTSSGINSSYYTNGSIDQVRIFNKALDAGEVLQLYNEPNN